MGMHDNENLPGVKTVHRLGREGLRVLVAGQEEGLHISPVAHLQMCIDTLWRSQDDQNGGKVWLQRFQVMAVWKREGAQIGDGVLWFCIFRHG